MLVDATPTTVRSDADARRKRRGSPRTLDGRTRAARRTVALVRIFEAALGGDPSAAQRVAILRAAHLTAIAECAAEHRLAGLVDLDPIRAHNAAERAQRVAGIKTNLPPAPAPKGSALDQHIAAKHGAPVT